MRFLAPHSVYGTRVFSPDILSDRIPGPLWRHIQSLACCLECDHTLPAIHPLNCRPLLVYLLLLWGCLSLGNHGCAEQDRSAQCPVCTGNLYARPLSQLKVYHLFERSVTH